MSSTIIHDKAANPNDPDQLDDQRDQPTKQPSPPAGIADTATDAAGEKPQFSSGDDRPGINLSVQRELHELTRACLDVLEVSNGRTPYIFTRGDSLVSVEMIANEQGQPTPTICILTFPHLLVYLSKACYFYRVVSTKGKANYITSDPPGKAVTAMLATPEDWFFPALDGLTEVPVVRTDGSI